jgi:hypothetical protein
MKTPNANTNEAKEPASAGCMARIVRCSGCGGEITPEMESPEQGICGVCLIYLEELRREQAQEERRVTVTREMAMDAGFPEMEGREW